MFFPDRITIIRTNDKVLEIGPGGTPHPRSDVLLELYYDDDEVFRQQRGNTDKLVTNKQIVYYDGNKIPFHDNEFDYVICSHVIEHVENIDFFLSEMFRVARRGYMEYPTIYYEYLYNFKHHLNFVKFTDNELVYLKKRETSFNDFKPIHRLFLNSLEKGHNKIIKDLKEFMFEGFEWSKPFKYRSTNSIEDIVWKDFVLPNYYEKVCMCDKVKY